MDASTGALLALLGNHKAPESTNIPLRGNRVSFRL
jgi:hypothetical protein